jgi:hypothetical protein
VKNLDGRPVWVSRPPQEIDGFPAGVGYAARQSRVGDTYAKSCDSAAAALISQLSTSLITSNTTTQNWNTTTIQQKSSGKLIHFTVLDIWLDPATNAVWTLAIAQGVE